VIDLGLFAAIWWIKTGKIEAIREELCSPEFTRAKNKV
jgi:hypothetical protein